MTYCPIACSGRIVSYRGCTWNADIADFEIERQVSGARLQLFQCPIRHLEPAAGPRRTQGRHVVNDVDRTADVTVVLGHTVADLHTSVPG